MADGDKATDKWASVAPTPNRVRLQRVRALAPERAKKSRLFERIGKITTAALSALATLLTVVFLLLPRLKPDEPAPPPSAFGATLSDVRLEERAANPDGTRNLVISYDVEFAAYKGHEGLIEWAAFDAATMERYDLAINRNDPLSGNQDGGKVIAEAATDRASGSFPVPVPLQAKCLFIRVYVSEPKKDGSRTRQDYADTLPFDTHDPSNRSCATLGVSPASSS
jgi:hypothetical protein